MDIGLNGYEMNPRYFPNPESRAPNPASSMPDVFVSKMPKTMVVIATAGGAGGRKELLRRTLASNAQAQCPPGYVKTIVVENGRERTVEGVVGEFHGSLAADYLFYPQANKSAALNALLATVTDDHTLLVFTDDDVRVAPSWLALYEQAAAQWGRGHFFGGPLSIDYPDGPPHPWTQPFLPASVMGWEWDGPEAVAEPVFLGANWAAFAGDLRLAGGFDAARGPGAPNGSTGEESAMQTRLLAHGMTGRYLPQARVWHYVPSERCSADWAIQRAHRHGVSAGLEYAVRGPIIGGYPPGIWGSRLLDWTRSALAAISFYPRWRFNARWWRSRNRGLRQGWRGREERMKNEG
jgi:hypothetical protein